MTVQLRLHQSLNAISLSARNTQRPAHSVCVTPSDFFHSVEESDVRQAILSLPAGSARGPLVDIIRSWQVLPQSVV